MSIHYGKKLLFSLAALVVMALSSCFTTNGSLAIKYPPTENGFSDALQWYGAIIADEDAAPSDKARAHTKLALLYAHYRNPDRDFLQAVKHLETAMSIDNSVASEDGVLNMHSILNATVSAKKGKTMTRLLAEMEAIKNENDELKQIIEQLNELDVELEKRRKLIK